MRATVDANCRTATGLIRMLRSCFSRSSVVLRLPKLPAAARALAAMTIPLPQWTPRPGNQLVPPYHVYNRNIIQSERDERDYRVIRLENGLEAVLVHDVKADKAAASLDVAVGHLYDPVCCLSTCGLCRVY